MVRPELLYGYCHKFGGPKFGARLMRVLLLRVYIGALKFGSSHMYFVPTRPALDTFRRGLLCAPQGPKLREQQPIHGSFNKLEGPSLGCPSKGSFVFWGLYIRAPDFLGVNFGSLIPQAPLHLTSQPRFLRKIPGEVKCTYSSQKGDI